MKRIIKNLKGSTAIMMIVVVMGGMLFVSLTVGQIVVNGLVSGRTQVRSTIAFYAAEAGSERFLWEIRQNGNLVNLPSAGGGNCLSDRNFCFDEMNDGNTPTADLIWPCQDLDVLDCDSIGAPPNYNHQLLSNDARYELYHQYSAPDTTITSTGSYLGINRIIEIEY